MMSVLLTAPVTWEAPACRDGRPHAGGVVPIRNWAFLLTKSSRFLH